VQPGTWEKSSLPKTPRKNNIIKANGKTESDGALGKIRAQLAVIAGKKKKGKHTQASGTTMEREALSLNTVDRANRGFQPEGGTLWHGTGKKS